MLIYQKNIKLILVQTKEEIAKKKENLIKKIEKKQKTHHDEFLL